VRIAAIIAWIYAIVCFAAIVFPQFTELLPLESGISRLTRSEYIPPIAAVTVLVALWLSTPRWHSPKAVRYFSYFAVVATIVLALINLSVGLVYAVILAFVRGALRSEARKRDA
jgi:hypothetical protein